ncbi:histidine kinase [Hymenobacter sp. IS2118]|uniref:sensor histidine kinase n=1 Tax=Hymenobacter sp. IS2118 TaxID=1505605 RepID=UPI0005560DCC|nr:histidine kinase [Hymenobacter sp. IS2118]
MKIWRRILLLLAALLPLLGGAEPPRAAGWLPDEALSGLMLRTLVQAPGGLLWAGTDDGVYRYDGNTLVSINDLRRTGPALPTVPCNLLLALPDGQLWLGTDAGLFRFLPNGRLEALPLPRLRSATRDVKGLALAPDNQHVWVTQGRVGVQAYTLNGRPTGPLLPQLEEVYETWPAPDGSLWVVGLKGNIRHLAPNGRLLGTWRHPQSRLCPVADPKGRIWLLSDCAAYRPGPAGQLVAVVRWADPRHENWLDINRRPTGPTLLCRELVRQLEWTAGPDPHPQMQFELPLPPWPTAGWSGRLHTDRSGNWWVFDSNTRGCWQRTASPVFIRGLAGPGGTPYSVRTSVRLPDGRLLVSTYEAGLLTQARDSPLAPLRPWAVGMLPTGNVPIIMGMVPAPLGPDRDWLMGGATPFLRFNPQTGRLREVPVQGLPQNNAGVLSLCRDAATGRVWGGTRTGLYWYDPARETFRPYQAPGATQPVLAGRIIEDIAPDGRGHLWLATPEGVERLNLASGARQVIRSAAFTGARCLYLAPEGRLWVGTRAHGLAVVEPDGRAHAALSRGQGLPNASVATITPSPGGYLWLGTYQGLVRYRPATSQLAVFTTAQGLLSDECNARAAYIDPLDGSLLIGGVAGLHRVWPAQVPGPRPVRPRLLLTGLTALSASAEASRTRHLLAAEALPALRLAPDVPLVDLHLALTDDFDARRARYFYRVRGWLADRWLGLGNESRLRLQGLPPGQYTVEVRAETSQGVPAANTLRLPLTVTATWWNRPLTWLLAGLVVVAFVYFWQRTRLQRMRQETTLRARLAADLHDEVGALLTRVTMQAEMLHELAPGPAPRLALLVEDSRAAASTVRDIIWSVDTAADTLGALTDRIRDYLDATARATGRTLLFDDADLPTSPDRSLAPAVRQHVYLIFKEAVNNALKYSQPNSPINIMLCCYPLLELRVSSQGEAPATSRAGQGLRNIRHRAKLLNAELGLGPVPGGWQVRLRLLA